jgi:hypothetical protein
MSTVPRPFWMVWNPQKFPPQAQHDTAEKAVNEAKRLAAAHPGEQFVVLMATHRVQRAEPVTVTVLADPDDMIPF